ncbi:2-succinyl-5-enolpyruvyl-6-hydroxy-3-cyclohexene-1-carboxylic-acid synthase [Spirulina sp. 06S082]|uniref:2-succinyl-5-enolpyruvyl-6-hydroxy-3- cyclohexene-1-carboxylic-acid synthase n=1 Tax=Spirulina sp. 06S082 TaxID=3110248 RepID=UPI002B20E61E|nr:2-succinyl-5-enolpyruvyl-6-hydroxy-3-cyclohexene-1-carboxylic-acid synthase [Spirulina sp. 06S082]MEA5470749.1 2-succinyl-5-enolpyruvyl-6-hydroxy-3-cyclohexene-1-carboxylic-acid synthase [Spirulina sp. 06S082]
MPLDFRNINTLCSSILVETLSRLGLTTAILCPGSRSTPLTVAFAQHDRIEAISILDERSASFFSLGIAKKSRLPVVLVCTSGTAAANFYPAIIEASLSGVSLLVLTADRPAELQHCRAGQTIDQLKIYGQYPNWQAQYPLPENCLEILHYWRQNTIQAWTRSRFPHAGVVHLNFPFRKPLAPIEQPEIKALESQIDEEEFFSFLGNRQPGIGRKQAMMEIPSQWQTQKKGIIIAGICCPQKPSAYCSAIAELSQTLQFPVLAEGLSPVRNYADLNPNLICTYDLLLRNLELAQELTPEIVIQIGELPTSKILRSWLQNTQPQRWIVDPREENLDPLHGKTLHLRTAIEQLTLPKTAARSPSPYLKQWQAKETQMREICDCDLTATKELFEGKIPWLLSQMLPPGTPLFIANSMPVRDVETFWRPNHHRIQPYFNRGANGIDGTLSTALGIAHRNRSSVLLTGDLSLLHDINGLLQTNKFWGHLTIILINNNGGGIFENLPIAQFNPPFEEFFATPQAIDFAELCAAYRIEYHCITAWKRLEPLLNPLPEEGIRAIEIPTHRGADAQWRKTQFHKWSNE